MGPGATCYGLAEESWSMASMGIVGLSLPLLAGWSLEAGDGRGRRSVARLFSLPPLPALQTHARMNWETGKANQRRARQGDSQDAHPKLSRIEIVPWLGWLSG